MHPLLHCSALELAAHIRDGRHTAAEVLAQHVAHLRAWHPTLNAMVQQRFEAARHEALRADEAVAAGRREDLPPLHGVPCTIKEAFAVAGMRNTGGLWARRDVCADADAVTVARLRAAGAVVMGTSNVSELCMWMEASNRIYGRTSTPYDASRTAGGSSGGEAALVGAGCSPCGLGSDVGGSIRLPAAFCGVFGHKPSGGLVSNDGQYPNASPDGQRILTTGPLCRRAEDLMPLLRILTGDVKREQVAPELSRALGDPAAIEIGRLRTYVVPDNGLIPVARSVRGGIRRAGRALQQAGAEVQTRRFSRLRRSLEIWAAAMQAAGGPSFRELLANGGHLSVSTELARLPLGRSDYTLPALFLCVLEEVSSRLPGVRSAASVLGDELRAELDAALGDDGVLLFPPYPTPAPRHGRPLLLPFLWVYTAIFNALQLPVTQVPVGFDAQGLPLGVQVVGPYGRDDLTIAVALQLQRSLGGWVPPPVPAGAEPHRATRPC